MKSRNSNLLNVIKFYLFYVSIVLIATPLGVYLISFLSENYLFGRSVSFELILKNSVLFFLIFFLTVQIYDQSKEIDRLELSDWKYRALRATLPATNANVIWLERNVWTGNEDSIHQCQQFVINYEDSIRRRHQMEVAAQQREQEGQRLMRASDSIKKQLRK